MRQFTPLLTACFLLAACPADTPDPGDTGEGDAGIAPTGSIIINEVSVTGAGDDWVEFYNRGESSVDLGGWLFTDAVPEHSYVFADNTILADGGFLVVPRSETAGFNFGLGSSDKIVLFDSEGKKAHELEWIDGEAPSGTTYGFLPDGEGQATTLYESTPGAPNASTTPSCDNQEIEFGEICDGSNLSGLTCQSYGYKSGDLSCAASCTLIDRSGCVLYETSVVINEVSSSDSDPIELKNISNSAVELSGWKLSDKREGESADLYTIPDGAKIPAGGYMVFNKNDHFAFGLGGDDAVALYSQEGLVDFVDWAMGQAKTSYCRLPDGEGDFTECATPTLSEANTP